MKLNLSRSRSCHATYLVPATATDMAAIVRARDGELTANKRCTITVFAYKHPAEIFGQDPYDNKSYQEYPIATYWIDKNESYWLRKPDKKLIGDNLQWVSKVEIIPTSNENFELTINWKGGQND